jgi:FMN phosphatase YigB (HAD superfamily)
LRRLGGVRPERSLFVDDNQLNVEAALALGMQAVHFRSTDQAVTEIRSILAT